MVQICAYMAANCNVQITIELRTLTMEWVFLEKVYEATAEEIAEYLKRLKSAYPENRIRAVNTATGKTVDLI